MLLSLLPPASRGAFGLMKFNVVLILGLVDSELELDASIERE